MKLVTKLKRAVERVTHLWTVHVYMEVKPGKFRHVTHLAKDALEAYEWMACYFAEDTIVIRNGTLIHGGRGPFIGRAF